MDFSVINRAGITQLEFSNICGVSRVSVNLWVRAKMHPHRYIQSKISKLVNGTEHAIKSNLLPLPPEIPKAERLPAIKMALVTAINGMTAAASV